MCVGSVIAAHLISQSALLAKLRPSTTWAQSRERIVGVARYRVLVSQGSSSFVSTSDIESRRNARTVPNIKSKKKRVLTNAKANRAQQGGQVRTQDRDPQGRRSRRRRRCRSCEARRRAGRPSSGPCREQGRHPQEPGGKPQVVTHEAGQQRSSSAAAYSKYPALEGESGFPARFHVPVGLCQVPQGIDELRLGEVARPCRA